MRICVIIPAHNEELQIAQIVAAVRAMDLDVVVIDDGSVDQTNKLAKSAGAVVLHNEIRKGKGYSLKRGFAHVLNMGYDGVIAMDGDGQHDPADLPAFITEAKIKQYCVINGTRMKNAKKMPFVRRATNQLMSWMISRLCHRLIEDTQCGFRYISSDVLRVIELTANEFEIETEILFKASRAGCDIVSIPVKTIYRDEKSKINPLKDTFRFAVFIARELNNQKS